RVGAAAGLGGAGAGGVARVGGRALDRRSDAGARLAAITLRARVPVVAAAAVGLGRVRARTGLRVAGTGAVALIGGRTLDGTADAGARLAAITLRAGVPVVAGAAVHLDRVRAEPGSRVA